MLKIPLDLAFKGERNYLQGPDLIVSAIDAISAAVDRKLDGKSRIMLLHKITTQPDILVFEPDEKTRREDDMTVLFTLSDKSGELHGAIIPSDRPVTTRIEYDEKPIIKQCSIVDETISIQRINAFTPLEVITSITKELHNVLMPIPENKHWVISQLELNDMSFLSGDINFSVSIIKKLGTRLTRSKIRSHGHDAGFIYFSPADQ